MSAAAASAAVRSRESTTATPRSVTGASSVAVTAGDYLVIEAGFRSATGTSRNISISYGDDSGTDLAEDDTTTTANNQLL